MGVLGFLVQKERMKGVFDRQGRWLPVTVLRAQECIVTQVKTPQKDGYWAVQLAAGRKKHSTLPILGHLKKAGVTHPVTVLREVPFEGEDVPPLGAKIKPSQVVQPGDVVKIQGKTKGRGFAGVIKRWGFASQRATHGHPKQRVPGSIGAQTPGRVLPGKKMPGHFGNQTATVTNLTVVWVDDKKGEIWVKGAVPGPTGGWLTLIKTGKNKNFIPLAIAQKEASNEQEKEKTTKK